MPAARPGRLDRGSRWRATTASIFIVAMLNTFLASMPIRRAISRGIFATIMTTKIAVTMAASLATAIGTCVATILMSRQLAALMTAPARLGHFARVPVRSPAARSVPVVGRERGGRRRPDEVDELLEIGLRHARALATLLGLVGHTATSRNFVNIDSGAIPSRASLWAIGGSLSR